MITPVYDWALEFSEGLATVRTGGRWGFVNPAGELAIECQWHKSFNFQGELTLVGTDHELFYINRAGETVWNPYG